MQLVNSAEFCGLTAITRGLNVCSVFMWKGEDIRRRTISKTKVMVKVKCKSFLCT